MKTGIIVLSVVAALTTSAPSPAQTFPDATEMARIFQADQAIRQNVKPEQYKDRAFVTRMIAEDQSRRARTTELMQQGKLTTADDFYYAAFIFQHGNDPDDYLLAHSLAVAAAALGKKEAPWIAAATLDRYLQKIGQKQIYGTQYLNGAATGPTMEPYNRTLISDALRQTLGVPAQVKQQARLKEMKTPASTGK